VSHVASTVVAFVLTVSALPVLAASLYLLLLAFLARQSSAPVTPGPRRCFDIVVPAHNEESEIAQTVGSLLAIEYPRDRFRVLVVADNCSDRTADVAAAAGAEVLIRLDAEQRGKGHALAFAFRRCLADGFCDAVVVVDADTLVSKNLLTAFDARFAGGAAALQADYGVRNPGSSWRTRLMTIALAAFHGVRSVARERMGISCGLRGNGMAFSTALLRTHPPGAFSIVEDLEYGIQLGYAGVRIEYVHDAHVFGYMAVSEHASRAQRRRWERGRQALVREHVPVLIADALRKRDGMLLDLALDLLVPPIGQLLMATVAGLMVSLLAVPFGVVVAPWLWAIALLGIVVHVLTGWAHSGVGLIGLRDLLLAPAYVVWKMTLRFSDKGKRPEEWVRTTREAGL
jgi:cellulose synthase/poly-beta-1,6-N-acetylglucosamine synthase-like glycosyltransferase